jgi:GGDEF domain-containing protein
MNYVWDAQGWGPRETVKLGNAHELRSQTQMIAVGVWLTYGVAIAAGAWVILTANEAHRMAMGAVLGVAAVLAFAISRLPAARIVRGRWREAFFLGWSALDIVFIAVLAGADGGAGSPANALFFLTVVFAALAYPLRSVVVVSVLNLGVFIFVGLLTHGQDSRDLSANVWLFSACLAAASAMCWWQSRIQTHLRNDLARASRTDPLTGALNRRGFEEFLAEVEAHTLVRGTGFDLLRWTVQEMTEALAAISPRGIVARLGGDEFAVVLHDADREEASLAADHLRGILSARIGATTGIACYPADGHTLEDLHRHADARLYATKRARPATPRGVTCAPLVEERIPTAATGA